MKTSVADILNELQNLAPLEYQESYDNSGLLTGNKAIEVSNVLLSLDCIEATIDEAIEKKCNVVLCHHPIIFKGLKSITGADYVQRTIIKAIQNNIAIIAWHTNLDNVLNGVNQKIANKLKLKNVKILNPKVDTLFKLVTYVPQSDQQKVSKALFDLGCGNLGNYSHCSFNVEGEGTFMPKQGAQPKVGTIDNLSRENEIRFKVLVPAPKINEAVELLKRTHSYEEVAYEIYPIANAHQEIGSGMIGELIEPMKPTEFLAWCKEVFGLEVIRHSDTGKKLIQKVAICGGAGSFLIKQAKSSSADAFVTSDIKYHEFFDGEDQLMICDIGHYESEISTLVLFHDVLSKKFTNFAALFTQVNTNPVKYYI
jgi:dinuclear metal center YbgI/SA1388 family protein